MRHPPAEERADMPPLPGVAVVVPCYNAGRTLAQTLESAIDQPGLAELVVVDDG